MLRRLPLLGTATKETPVLSAVRAPLGPGSIGIADTSSGELAARFACDLAIAFARLGARVRLTVLGYQGEPVLDRGLVAELTAHGITPVQRAVRGDGDVSSLARGGRPFPFDTLVDPEGPLAASVTDESSRARGTEDRSHAPGLASTPGVDPTRAHGETPEVRLFVGLPALGACRPALALVLGADRPLNTWPEVLRGVRDELAATLAGARVGLAPLLATALIERGFLPRG
jgi:hypothetical protein